MNPFDTLVSSLVIIGIVFMAFLDAILYFLFKVRLAHSPRNIIGIVVGTILLLILSFSIKTEGIDGEILSGWPVGFWSDGGFDIFKLICGLLFYSLFVLDGFTIIKILRMKVFKKSK